MVLRTEDELKQSTNFKLAGDEETISALQKEAEKSWELEEELPVFTIKNTEGHSATVIEKESIPLIINISSIIVHFICMLDVFALLYLIMNPGSMTNSEDAVRGMAIISNILYYIDAIIVNLCYYKKRSLYLWIWMAGPMYMGSRDEHVYDIRIFGYILPCIFYVLLFVQMFTSF